MGHSNDRASASDLSVRDLSGYRQPRSDRFWGAVGLLLSIQSYLDKLSSEYATASGPQFR
jgi:hypothetical protein